MKRILTKREVEAYQLCHTDFDGLLIDDAAARMGITRKAVLRLLKNIERKAPQLSPVLTPCQRAILYLLEKNLSPKEIALGMGLSDSYIYSIAGFLQSRGFIAAPAATVRYNSSMDGEIKEVF